ncbi:MAG: hypothetical protein H6695_10120 [Deferribacteres bacterium]|nr:hypothetical protein [candidate division KSB1 bacterium]MCB9510528.1 hypothetical protein [Deferribacteres bacterium]
MRIMMKKHIFSIMVLAVLASTFAYTQTPQKYIMRFSSDWQIDNELPEKAMLISLQGVVNGEAPQLYFLYPDDWDFNFVEPLYDYYRDTRSMQFQELASADEALAKLANKTNGYVVWDTNVRTSLIVAFTAAGVHQAIVVSEDLIPLAEQHGLSMKEDLRGLFAGKSDYEIYEWAYDKYWDQTNHEYLVYMGGEHGKVMKPGVADWGIYKRSFFTDASTDPADTLEYQFANKILSQMKPNSFVFGWHSYKKDKEAQHVRLTSSYALRVEGLHTLPNMSFNHQIPLAPGFKFSNKHNVEAGKRYIPKEKVYVACIQTDCLGIGAWTKPGRGELPYAWEVTMNWSWLAPAMMQYFYDQATPNDYFIGSLSGPGYMYPRSVPIDKLPQVVSTAYELMQNLDLNVFEIMEHSNYWESDGVDDDLPKEIIDVYYQEMPDVLGFANGYRPAHTFTSRDGKPFISYDYYLGEKRDEKEATADLIELSNLNPKRPYFLLLHVRQWSDIKRVKRILDALPDEFEVVPLDIFLKMAGEQPTFQERYLESMN